MQINSEQTLKMLKQIDLDALEHGFYSTCFITNKKIGLGARYLRLGIKQFNTPVRAPQRAPENLYQMQNWALEELIKTLYPKNK